MEKEVILPAAANTSSKQFKRTGDTFKVPLSKVKIEEAFNHRTKENFKNMDELAASLEQNGQLEAAFGFIDKESGNVILTTGHRRYTAWHMVAKKTGQEPEMLIQFKGGSDPVERLVLQFTENLKVPNTEFESALIVRDLEANGLKKEDIMKRLGISQATVYGLKKLLKTDPSVQEHLRKGEVSGTLVNSIYADVKGDNAKLTEAVEAAVLKAKADGKTKATARHSDQGKTRTTTTVIKNVIGKLEAKGEEGKASKNELFALAILQKVRDKVTDRTLLDFIRSGGK